MKLRHMLIIYLFILTFSMAVKVAAQDLPVKSYWIDTDDYGKKINTGVAKERYSEDNSGNKHGKYISYYRNGNKEILANYNNGVLEGAYEEYFPDGEPKVKASYKNGKLHGTALFIRDLLGLGLSYSGIKATYDNGSKEGYYEERAIKESEIPTFFKNTASVGYLIHKGEYKNDLQNGEWFEHGQEDGSMASGTYILGKKNGEWINAKILNPEYNSVGFEKGWKVIFDNDKVVKIISPEGVDIIGEKRNEEAKVEKIKQEQEQLFSNYIKTDNYNKLIELYQSGSLSPEKKIHLYTYFKNFLSKGVNQEVANFFFSNSYSEELSYVEKKEIEEFKELYNLKNPSFTGEVNVFLKESKIQEMFPMITDGFGDQISFNSGGKCSFSIVNGKLDGLQVISPNNESERVYLYCIQGVTKIGIRANVNYSYLHFLNLYQNNQSIFQAERTEGSFNGQRTWVLNNNTVYGGNAVFSAILHTDQYLPYYIPLFHLLVLIDKERDVRLMKLGDLAYNIADDVVPKTMSSNADLEGLDSHLKSILSKSDYYYIAMARICVLLKLSKLEEAKVVFSKYRTSSFSDGSSFTDTLQKYLKKNKKQLPENYKTIFN